MELLSDRGEEKEKMKKVLKIEKKQPLAPEKILVNSTFKPTTYLITLQCNQLPTYSTIVGVNSDSIHYLV